MAQRSTRNKIKFQAVSAFADLKRAQDHLVEMAALADGGSPHIEKDLPLIVAAVEMVIDAVEKFSEGL